MRRAGRARAAVLYEKPSNQGSVAFFVWAVTIDFLARRYRLWKPLIFS